MHGRQHDISLEVLAKNGRLSSRAYNAFMRNGLTSLQQAANHYYRCGTFLNLSKVGPQSGHELLALVKQWQEMSLPQLMSEMDNGVAEVQATFPGELVSRLHLLVSEGERVLAAIFREECNKLSVRAYNGLHKLCSKQEAIAPVLLKIFEPGFDFSTLTNIGEKSRDQLNEFRQRIADRLLALPVSECSDMAEEIHEVVEEAQPVMPDSPLSSRPVFYAALERLKVLSPGQQLTLERQVKSLLPVLSKRARNGINRLIIAAGGMMAALRQIFDEDFYFKAVKGVGEKAAHELDLLRVSIDEVLAGPISEYKAGLVDSETLRAVKAGTRRRSAGVIRSDSETVQTAKAGTLRRFPDAIQSDNDTRQAVRDVSGFASDNKENLQEEYQDATGRWMLFKLFHCLVRYTDLIKGDALIIFQLVFSRQPFTVTELDLTGERIRQLKKIMLNTGVENYFGFIDSFSIQTIQLYEDARINNPSLLVIDEQMAALFNEREGAAFNTLFYVKVFCYLFKKTHALVLSESSNTRTRGNHHFNTGKNYLIENTLLAEFDFVAFLENMAEKKKRKRQESYSLHFEGFLLGFSKQAGELPSSAATDVCEHLLLHEFDMVVQDGFLLFEKNTGMYTSDYIAEVLQEAGQLMTAAQIVARIREKYPLAGIDITEDLVQNNCQRKKDLFICIGRSGVYGLKRWEEEQHNLKGGTIRDIVEDYLLQEEEPRHITEIMDRVLQYRDTDEGNVLTNIKQCATGRFITFPGGFVGLSGKHYAQVGNYRSLKHVNNKKFIRQFVGRPYEELITAYATAFGYRPVQVRSCLDKKVKRKEIVLSPDQIIKRYEYYKD